jgi:hypothetical protein
MRKTNWKEFKPPQIRSGILDGQMNISALYLAEPR